jgi:hypothetical protein
LKELARQVFGADLKRMVEFVSWIGKQSQSIQIAIPYGQVFMKSLATITAPSFTGDNYHDIGYLR